MSGRVFVARHGETLLNALGRVQGWSDSPLTARGRAEAEVLGRALVAARARIGAARCADLGRHRETASAALAVAAPAVRARPDARWREFAFGAYEGSDGPRLWADLAQAHGMADAAALRATDLGVLEVLGALPVLGQHASVPVESVPEVQARALGGLDEAVDAASDLDVLIVTSGLTLLALLAALGIDTAAFEGGIGNGAVLTLVRDAGDGGWMLEPAGVPQAGASVSPA